MLPQTQITNKIEKIKKYTDCMIIELAQNGGLNDAVDFAIGVGTLIPLTSPLATFVGFVKTMNELRLNSTDAIAPGLSTVGGATSSTKEFQNGLRLASPRSQEAARNWRGLGRGLSGLGTALSGANATLKIMDAHKNCGQLLD